MSNVFLFILFHPNCAHPCPSIANCSAPGYSQFQLLNSNFLALLFMLTRARWMTIQKLKLTIAEGGRGPSQRNDILCSASVTEQWMLYNVKHNNNKGVFSTHNSQLHRTDTYIHTHKSGNTKVINLCLSPPPLPPCRPPSISSHCYPFGNN